MVLVYAIVAIDAASSKASPGRETQASANPGIPLSDMVTTLWKRHVLVLAVLLALQSSLLSFVNRGQAVTELNTSVMQRNTRTLAKGLRDLRGLLLRISSGDEEVAAEDGGVGQKEVRARLLASVHARDMGVTGSFPRDDTPVMSQINPRDKLQLIHLATDVVHMYNNCSMVSLDPAPAFPHAQVAGYVAVIVMLASSMVYLYGKFRVPNMSSDLASAVKLKNQMLMGDRTAMASLERLLACGNDVDMLRIEDIIRTLLVLAALGISVMFSLVTFSGDREFKHSMISSFMRGRARCK